MTELSPTICPCCDVQFDERQAIDETTRVLYFHYRDKKTCIMEDGKPVHQMELAWNGVKEVRD